ncbi:ATP-dependent metallopeptidase FtsH/Yme1/Tma family protein [Roseburia yibonii]
MDYGIFLSMVDKKEVSKVQIEDDMIYFQDKEETPNYYETAAFEDPDLVERLYDAGCSFDRVVQKEMSPLLSFLLTWILPILIFAGLGELLSANMDKLHKIAKYLYEQETITGEEFMKLLEEKEES